MRLRSIWTRITYIPDRLRVVRPVMKLASKYLDDGDCWKSLDHPVPLRLYGLGSRNDFAWYFTGECKVPVEIPEDICEWLASCEYVHDTELFFLADFWQHPTAFERIGKGDCEDHALWAWRRLCELGYSAEFVVGRWAQNGRWGGHAWVVFEKEDGRFLLEGVDTEPETMITPLEGAKHVYRPHFGVDHRLTRKIYSGYVALFDRK